MFEDSLVESGGRLKTKRGATTVLSFFLEFLFLGVLVLLPLIFTEALPTKQLMTLITAPPPPPPPPPPPAAAPVIVKKIQSELDNGQLRTPTAIPKKIQMIKEDEPPPSAGPAGVVGGVPGGVPGGAMGGVLGSVMSSVPTAVPKVATPQPRPRIAGRFARFAGPQGHAAVSTAGQTGAYSGRCRAAGPDRQGWQHSEPARGQWPSHADQCGLGSSKGMEVQALLPEWRTGRGGNHDQRELQFVR